MISELSLDLTEEYKYHLSKPYWELHEAITLLCGVTNFLTKYPLPQEVLSVYGIDHFDFFPDIGLRELMEGPHKEKNIISFGLDHSQDFLDQYDFLLEMVLEGVFIREIKSFPIDIQIAISTRKPERPSYLIQPLELLGYVLAKGIQLPQELEIAANIYPLVGPKLRDKDVKRRAIIHCCRFQKPNDILEHILKKIKTLKKHRYNFKYLHSNSR